MNGWIVAERRKRKPLKPPRMYVSINRRGEIAMNHVAFRAIGEPASVTLLYDPDQRRIGVKRPISADGHFFLVRRYGRGRRMRIVRAARMMRQFDIALSHTLIYINPETDLINNLPVIILPLDIVT